MVGHDECGRRLDLRRGGADIHSRSRDVVSPRTVESALCSCNGRAVAGGIRKRSLDGGRIGDRATARNLRGARGSARGCSEMKVTVLYVGTSLPGPLAQAERDIRASNRLDLSIKVYGCGAELTDVEWRPVETDLNDSEIIFIIHVTNQENAGRIIRTLKKSTAKAVIAINCMPDLMRMTRMGKLDFGGRARETESSAPGSPVRGNESAVRGLVKKLGSWLADSMKKGHSGDRSVARRNRAMRYSSLIGKLPAILKFVPSAGRMRDAKHYIFLFAYFLQPTPRNIRSMVLYAIKQYVPGHSRIDVEPLETLPALALYHPDAPGLFETFEQYRKWYERARDRRLSRESTIGLLLMRPQVVSAA